MDWDFFRVYDLSISFGGLKAVDNVGFRISRGSTVQERLPYSTVSAVSIN